MCPCFFSILKNQCIEHELFSTAHHRALARIKRLIRDLPVQRNLLWMRRVLFLLQLHPPENEHIASPNTFEEDMSLFQRWDICVTSLQGKPASSSATDKKSLISKVNGKLFWWRQILNLPRSWRLLKRTSQGRWLFTDYFFRRMTVGVVA